MGIRNIIFNNLQSKTSPFFTKDWFKNKPYKIGDYTYGKPLVLFDDAANLTIGKFCSIADNVKMFLGGNHRVDWISTYPFNALSNHFSSAKHIKGHPATKGDVTIGNDVWIGHSVTILSGITIGDGVVIGAESVVTKDIPPYQIWVGNPAKMVKKRFTDEQIHFLLRLKWWDWDKDKIENNVDV